jgi:hypothetical protein
VSEPTEINWDEQPAVLTYRDISRLLGIKGTSVRRYRHRGASPLPPPDYLVDQRATYRQETVRAWIETRNRQGRQPREATA